MIIGKHLIQSVCETEAKIVDWLLDGKDVTSRKFPQHGKFL